MPYKDSIKYKQYQKEYRIKNHTRLADYDKQKYLKNKKQIIERVMRYNKQNPEKNKVWLTNSLKNRKAKFYTFLYSIKANSCLDCKNVFPPYVMQFDHRLGEQKLWEVGTMLGRSEEVILAEIAKCDLVCANCHAIRTWKRRRDLCKS